VGSCSRPYDSVLAVGLQRSPKKCVPACLLHITRTPKINAWIALLDFEAKL
jgi:hypothetical protein